MLSITRRVDEKVVLTVPGGPDGTAYEIILRVADAFRGRVVLEIEAPIEVIVSRDSISPPALTGGETHA